jgi:hypothetical protein
VKSIEECEITECYISSMKERKHTPYTNPSLRGEQGGKHVKCH